MVSRKKQLRTARTWLDVSIVGIQFPVAIAIGYFWGHWMDGALGTEPWLTIIFALFGVIAGFVNLFRITLDATRAEEREAQDTAQPPGEGAVGGEGDGA